MTWSLLLLFCRKELRDLRSNRQMWPGYLILPVVGVLLPVVAILTIPLMSDPGDLDSSIRMLIEAVERDPTLAGATVGERLARLIIRDFGLWYLFMPVVLAAGPAGLSIVREKEQRTLEPILATPLGDRELVLSKLVGALGPALLWTFVSAVVGCAVCALTSGLEFGVAIGPTAGNLVGFFLLGPVLAAAAALAGIGVSARFTDSQSANMFVGVLIIPLTLIVLGLVGRPAMAHPAIGFAATGVGLLGCAVLFGPAVRRLRREELLTRWR